MASNWKTIQWNTVEDVFSTLLELAGKSWLSRGQSEPWNALIPSVDRDPLASILRREKLDLERRSINTFRTNARNFNSEGERAALKDDFIALMVLRHYSVPTRLLDWSLSPYVAVYFAAEKNCDDGELWSFDEPRYAEIGKAQWRRWPGTTSDHSGDPYKFEAGLTAFNTEVQADWVIAAFYPKGFPRQNAQNGAYTLTARFGRDHAEALDELLLSDPSNHCRYIIPKGLKAEVLRILREQHGISRWSLFPDSAGAAETAGLVFPRRNSI